MQHDYFDHFHPKIVDVFRRDPSYWNRHPTPIISTRTRLNSFLYAFDGFGTLQLDDTSYPLSKGCVFHFQKNRNLKLHSSQSKLLCYYTVQYEFTFVEWEGRTPSCTSSDLPGLPFDQVLKISDPENMLQQMKALYDLWYSKAPGSSGTAKLAFLNLLHQVHEEQFKQRDDDPTLRSIRHCMEYIQHHYKEPLERETLARKASLSTSYFSVMFKKYAGCSPVQYITRIRLGKARQLLREQGLSVAEVAREVGFRDPLYFTRVFSNEIGMSPVEYRKP